MRLLSANDIYQLISMRESIELLRNGYCDYKESSIISPQRTLIYEKYSGAVLGVMPIYEEDNKSYVVKIAAFNPQNALHGRRSVNSVVIFQNGETGEVEFMMDGNALTGLRTGGTSGLVTDLLAGENSEKLAIIGSGFQALHQLKAMLCVRNFEQVSIYSRNQKNVENFISIVKNEINPGIKLIPENSIKDAISDADIICTATTSRLPLFGLSHIKPNIHINMVGMHTTNSREVEMELIANSFLVVENIASAVKEAGGYNISATEIPNLFNVNVTRGRRTTVFASNGTAFQDLCLASGIVNKAKSLNLGIDFDFNQ